MFFAQGGMTGTNPLTAEWVQMTNAVKGGGRSLENYSIPLALSSRSPHTQTKQTDEDDKNDEGSNGDSTGQKLGKSPKKGRKGRKKHSKKGVDMETRLKKAVKIEVFVDDFIVCTDAMSQNSILKISQAMLHGIHSVFPPQDITGYTSGDPIFENSWDFTKQEILGWILDGANYTIQLPPAKVEKMVHTLRALGKKKKVRLKEFQKIARSLHHASMGIPGG